MRNQLKLQLVLEREGSNLWGRVSYNENLIVDSATTLRALEKKLVKALKDFENSENVEFEYFYDLTVLFEEFDFLNQSKIAEYAGINPSLIRQYSSGNKHPSIEQALKIEQAIMELGEKLKNVKISPSYLFEWKNSRKQDENLNTTSKSKNVTNMSKSTNRTVSKNDSGQWQNKKHGNDRATSVHDTQKAAEAAARQNLKKEGGGELITHGLDGKIRSKDTIAPGNDPRSIKDKEH